MLIQLYSYLVSHIAFQSYDVTATESSKLSILKTVLEDLNIRSKKDAEISFMKKKEKLMKSLTEVRVRVGCVESEECFLNTRKLFLKTELDAVTMLGGWR